MAAIARRLLLASLLSGALAATSSLFSAHSPVDYAAIGTVSFVRVLGDAADGPFVVASTGCLASDTGCIMEGGQPMPFDRAFARFGVDAFALRDTDRMYLHSSCFIGYNAEAVPGPDPDDPYKYALGVAAVVGFDELSTVYAEGSGWRNQLHTSVLAASSSIVGMRFSLGAWMSHAPVLSLTRIDPTAWFTDTTHDQYLVMQTLDSRVATGLLASTVGEMLEHRADLTCNLTVLTYAPVHTDSVEPLAPDSVPVDKNGGLVLGSGDPVWNGYFIMATDQDHDMIAVATFSGGSDHTILSGLCHLEESLANETHVFPLDNYFIYDIGIRVDGAGYGYEGYIAFVLVGTNIEVSFELTLDTSVWIGQETQIVEFSTNNVGNDNDDGDNYGSQYNLVCRQLRLSRMADEPTELPLPAEPEQKGIVAPVLQMSLISIFSVALLAAMLGILLKWRLCRPKYTAVPLQSVVP